MSEKKEIEQENQDVEKEDNNVNENAKTDKTEMNEKENIEDTEDIGLDYSGLLDENDIINIAGEKFKVSDLEKVISMAKKHKDILEKIEQNPELVEKIQNVAVKQPINENKLTEEQEVMITLLQREYLREWEKVKDKYPLVEADEVWAKLSTATNKNPDQVEVVAQKLQAYFEKKLEQKQKQKQEAVQKAQKTKFEIGDVPVAPPPAEDDFVDINDTNKIISITKNFLRKKE
ncbi:MAG: hypothetical protein NC918_02745 [Candidatus Omnitrophica bacterium]|nr:hypothetical protein [Candidatus Omnitrophota bacterium]